MSGYGWTTVQIFIFVLLIFLLPQHPFTLLLNFPLGKPLGLGDADSSHDFKVRVFDLGLSHCLCLSSGTGSSAGGTLSSAGMKGLGIPGPEESADLYLHLPLCHTSTRQKAHKRGSMEDACSLRADPRPSSCMFLSSHQETDTEHARGGPSSHRWALPATSELNGTKLKWVDPNRRVRSCTCLSFVLKQCSIDFRAGRECTWLIFW